MLTKQAKPGYKRLISFTFRTILIAEAFGVAVTYGLWYKLNTDRGKFALVLQFNKNKCHKPLIYLYKLVFRIIKTGLRQYEPCFWSFSVPCDVNGLKIELGNNIPCKCNYYITLGAAQCCPPKFPPKV